MTTEQINTLWRKVLVAMGWKLAGFYWLPPAGYTGNLERADNGMPKLTLDALREIEEKLQSMDVGHSSNANDHKSWMYTAYLAESLGLRLFDNGEWVGSHMASLFPLATASAEHRLIALARVLGIKEGA